MESETNKREKTLKGFRRWLCGTLGDDGAHWDWNGLTPIERDLFESKEVFDEVVKFAKSEHSVLG